jgi:hypothetical protein
VTVGQRIASQLHPDLDVLSDYFLAPELWQDRVGVSEKPITSIRRSPGHTSVTGFPTSEQFWLIDHRPAQRSGRNSARGIPSFFSIFMANFGLMPRLSRSSKDRYDSLMPSLVAVSNSFSPFMNRQ